MNSFYEGKTLIELSNLTSNVYNFSNNGSESKKVASNLFSKQARHVARWSRGHASHARKGTQGRLAREQVRKEDTLARKQVSTQDTLITEHAST